MKKLNINLKNIIIFFLGAILASGITVYAVINANDVKYKDNQNVAEALNDLYSKVSDFEIEDNYFVSTYGTEADVKTLSKVLSCGKYIISAQDSEGTWWNTSGSSTATNYINLIGNKNCIITKLDEHQIEIGGAGYCVTYHAIYKVEVIEDNTTIIQQSVSASSSNTNNRETMSMQIVKIK